MDYDNAHPKKKHSQDLYFVGPIMYVGGIWFAFHAL